MRHIRPGAERRLVEIVERRQSAREKFAVDHALGEAIDRAEAEAEAPGFSFVVRSMQIEFLKPARMDDLLEVTTWPLEVKGASMTLGQKVARGDVTLVEARVKVAFVSDGKAKPIPKALRIVMRADQDFASPQ